MTELNERTNELRTKLVNEEEKELQVVILPTLSLASPADSILDFPDEFDDVNRNFAGGQQIAAESVEHLEVLGVRCARRLRAP